jgi:hypothetical protein
MQTLLFAMSGEHVGPFVRVPRAHHTVQEKRVTLHVLFRGLTRARNGHRAKRRVVLVKDCLYHQVGVILVQFFERLTWAAISSGASVLATSKEVYSSTDNTTLHTD